MEVQKCAEPYITGMAKGSIQVNYNIEFNAPQTRVYIIYAYVLHTDFII